MAYNLIQEFPPAESVQIDGETHAVCSFCNTAASFLMLEDPSTSWEYACKKCHSEFGVLYPLIHEL